MVVGVYPVLSVKLRSTRRSSVIDELTWVHSCRLFGGVFGRI